MSGSQFILCAMCGGNYAEGGAFTRINVDGNKLVHRRCADQLQDMVAMQDAKKNVAKEDAAGDFRAAFERARAQMIRYPHMLRNPDAYVPDGRRRN